ncbi:unnamed protein product (macronuclear) [Paramecium tetraurelia]|uniref:Transmembrane protein n=1 Tax=Paramecium tetraurelia TaxID=5888 RepID=A0DZ79_PARTE|nr:uncharacterized protein GSPATT00003315001 [Paramecium tetraurelia]CAK88346.1 unnamed protein product [Paramecium tetraurelia]|eukprot:XP_001455743.1 hypothetical protein (macronuclear) [Paramecium tetraurelia strain d4-2]
MITTEINSNDPIVDIDPHDQQSDDRENKVKHLIKQSPNEFIVVEVEKRQEQSELQEIYEEQLDIQQLKLKEIERQERIKKIPITLKRQLSTINELSDQSINNSCSPQIDVDHHHSKKQNKDVRINTTKQFLFQIQEENKQTEPRQVDKQKQQKKKFKKKKKKKQLTRELTQVSLPIPEMKYQQNMNFKYYYRDQRIDCSWKLLFSYFTIIILSNITLHTIEMVRYSQSVCKLEGIDNLFIYANQLFYILGKIGLLSLNYQEFTNTLPTKSKIPLFNSVIFSSIFVVLSMPLYVFDFVLCQPRSRLITLQESLQILNFFDWGVISVLGVVILMHSCLKISMKKKTWKTLKKFLMVIYYLLLLLVHLLQVLVTVTQSFNSYLPAMIMENFYLCFSIIAMIYLSMRKFCFHSEPFQFAQQKLPNDPMILISDEKLNNWGQEEKFFDGDSIKLSKRTKLSPSSSQFNSLQITQIGFLAKKD